MHREENNQYFSVNNGQYYVKRTIEDFFYLLKESGEWKYDPSLSDEFYDILSGYMEITEEAMDEVIREKKKQAAPEKTADPFIIDDDCVFRIVCNTMAGPTDTMVYNDGEIHLEFSRYEGSNLVKYIECIYAECVEIEDYYLPDYTEIEDVRKVPDISLNDEDREGFLVYLNLMENQLDILINEYLLATCYYADGRVEYYYDDDLRLLYIKVKNLTPEEYQYFSNI